MYLLTKHERGEHSITINKSYNPLIIMKTYSSTNQIQNIDDVKAFFHHLAFDMSISFHPDDTFEEMVSPGYLGFFSPENMVLYDTLMDKCWQVCEQTDTNIYQLGIEFIRERFLKRDN